MSESEWFNNFNRFKEQYPDFPKEQERSACRVICTKNNPLNCWNSILLMYTTLKTFELQHNTLNGISVNVAKAEKIE